jgi:hypothetical protein
MRANIMGRFAGVLPVAALLALQTGSIRAELRVSSDFESGSARVIEIDQATQTVLFQSAGDAARGWPNWWFLRVDGADPQRPVVFKLRSRPEIAANWTMPSRAAFSTNGTTWVHTAPGERRGAVETYRVNTPSGTFWLAWGPPFTVSDAKVFVHSVATEHSFATEFELCKSLEGRSVPALQIAEGNPPDDKRPGIWILARQHAWEVGGSWVARGFVEWLVGSDEHARWIRQHAEVFVVPIMDADRVATGDGGKNSQPHDHNFDWTETPHYMEVAAAQKQMQSLVQQGRMEMLLDLHNPGAGSPPELYVIPGNLVSAATASRQDRFISLLREQVPDFKIVDEHPRSDAPEDQTRWQSLTAPWLQSRANPQTICFTFETPWNAPRGTTESYRETGRRLGLVIEKYLHGPEKP